MKAGNIVGSVACPSCRAKGGDSTGNHCMVFKDGGGYCNRCEISYKAEDIEHNFDTDAPGKAAPKRSKPVSKESTITRSEVLAMPASKLESRGIVAPVVKYFGVRTESSEATGDVSKVYFPVYSSSLEFEGYKVKGYNPKSFSHRPVGSLSKAPAFFGQDKCSQASSWLIITEGQEDAMAAFQMMTKYYKTSPKFKDQKMKVNAVSLQFGAGSAKAMITENYKFLSSYKNIVLFMDADEPGQEAAREFAKQLPGNVALADWSATNAKDVNELLNMGDEGQKIFVNMYFSAKPYTPAWIVRGSEIEMDWLRRECKEGLRVPFQGLMNKLHGFRPGEFTILTASSGGGKTTFTRCLAYYLNTMHNEKIGKIFLEETAQKTAMASIALDHDIPIRKLMEDTSLLSDKEWMEGRDKILKNEVFINHFGSLDTDDLLDKLHYLHYQEGCQTIILDHLSMVVSGQRTTISGSERKDIDIICTELASFAVKTGVKLLTVVHLKRKDGKPYSRGGNIDMSDLRGSGGLEQLAFNIIALQRDMMDEDTKNVVNLSVLKNREWGDTGFCGTLKYNPDTGWMTDLEVLGSIE